MTNYPSRFLHRIQHLSERLDIRNGRLPALCKITLFSAALATILSACATQGSRVVVESENQDTRVRVVVIHFTTADFQNSLNILTKDSSRPVSSHYLIPEHGDPSYSGENLKLYSLVKEEGRAWHAGSSYWAGKTSLNDMSVGIELVNQTYCHTSDVPVAPENIDEGPASICFYKDFDDSQLEILTDLLKGILDRHTEVKPTHIIGHADITPQRKIDPGPRFPWQRLYRMGYGAWYDDDTVIKYWELSRKEIPPILTLQTALNNYGYEIELSGEYDKQSRNVVRAFQMHFVPWQVTGEFNAETVAVLYALLEKYYPTRLELLMQMDELANDAKP